MILIVYYICAFIAGFLVPIVSDYYKVVPCDPKIIEKVAINGSEWVAQKRGVFCGFRRGGNKDIVVASRVQSKPVVVATGDDIFLADLDGHSFHKLLITAPTFSDVKPAIFAVPELDVVFRYKPVDDPEQHARYRDWLGDKSNEQNRIWYCRTVLPTLGDYFGRKNDAYLAYTTRPRPNAPDPNSYCDLTSASPDRK